MRLLKYFFVKRRAVGLIHKNSGVMGESFILGGLKNKKKRKAGLL
jgi:hypothetical protein